MPYYEGMIVHWVNSELLVVPIVIAYKGWNILKRTNEKVLCRGEFNLYPYITVNYPE